MALVALGFLMLVLQRKLGVLVVIEALRRLPVTRIMTILALVAQRALVRFFVILLMAGDTGLAEFFAGHLVTA